MTWQAITEPGAIFAEALMRDDDGTELGAVLRYWDDGPTYGQFMDVRLGAFTTDQAAKKAVEEARVAFQGPGSALSRMGGR